MLLLPGCTVQNGPWSPLCYCRCHIASTTNAATWALYRMIHTDTKNTDLRQKTETKKINKIDAEKIQKKPRGKATAPPRPSSLSVMLIGFLTQSWSSASAATLNSLGPEKRIEQGLSSLSCEHSGACKGIGLGAPAVAGDPRDDKWDSSSAAVPSAAPTVSVFVSMAPPCRWCCWGKSPVTGLSTSCWGRSSRWSSIEPSMKAAAHGAPAVPSGASGALLLPVQRQTSGCSQRDKSS